MKKLIFTALLSLSLAAQDQNIFYKDADIKTFAQDIALLTDKTIILSSRLILNLAGNPKLLFILPLKI